MTMLNKETMICMSIAQRASSFGVAVHNAAFEAERLNAVYLARQLEPGEKNLYFALEGIRVLGIRGCGVSMPFKIEAAKYMDELDESAKTVGAINTVVNESGKLVGFNTDYYGAIESLRGIEDLYIKKVLLLGAGGVALAIAAALSNMGVHDVGISNRSVEKSDKIAKKYDWENIPWDKRNKFTGDVLINATSIGMNPYSDKSPLNDLEIVNYKTVFDVVLDPVETHLIKLAKKNSMDVITGNVMCLHQAAKQFELYTGKKPPLEIMKQAIIKVLSK
jgi:shikimate dehydrogenase